MSRNLTFCPFCTANNYEIFENPKLISKNQSSHLQLRLTLQERYYKPQFKQKVSEILTISSGKFPMYTIKDVRDEISGVEFHQKELINVV